jgi:hypothetical protein
VGAVRRLVPVKNDGTDDKSRKEIFMGNSQLISPDGPAPIQVKIDVENLEDAINAFPAAMRKGLGEMVERYKQNQQEAQKKDESRIITP